MDSQTFFRPSVDSDAVPWSPTPLETVEEDLAGAASQSVSQSSAPSSSSTAKARLGIHHLRPEHFIQVFQACIGNSKLFIPVISNPDIPGSYRNAQRDRRAFWQAVQDETKELVGFAPSDNVLKEKVRDIIEARSKAIMDDRFNSGLTGPLRDHYHSLIDTFSVIWKETKRLEEEALKAPTQRQAEADTTQRKRSAFYMSLGDHRPMHKQVKQSYLSKEERYMERDSRWAVVLERLRKECQNKLIQLGDEVDVEAITRLSEDELVDLNEQLNERAGDKRRTQEEEEEEEVASSSLSVSSTMRSVSSTPSTVSRRRRLNPYIAQSVSESQTDAEMTSTLKTTTQLLSQLVGSLTGGGVAGGGVPISGTENDSRLAALEERVTQLAESSKKSETMLQQTLSMMQQVMNKQLVGANFGRGSSDGVGSSIHTQMQPQADEMSGDPWDLA